MFKEAEIEIYDLDLDDVIVTSFFGDENLTDPDDTIVL